MILWTIYRFIRYSPHLFTSVLFANVNACIRRGPVQKKRRLFFSRILVTLMWQHFALVLRIVTLLCTKSFFVVHSLSYLIEFFSNFWGFQFLWSRRRYFWSVPRIIFTFTIHYFFMEINMSVKKNLWEVLPIKWNKIWPNFSGENENDIPLHCFWKKICSKMGYFLQKGWKNLLLS